MRLTWLFISLAAVAPQGVSAEMGVGFFRGSFESLEGTAATGVIEARNSEGAVESCGYDTRSYFERSHERVPPAQLAAGETIEVLADHKPGSRSCYARIVHVLEPHPAALRPPKPAPPASIPLSGPLARGDRSIAGLVQRHQDNALWIRTRSGEQVVVLRPDTRYVDSGIRVDATAVPVHARVFVRAGRNLYGEVEAYLVAWGEVLKVR